MKKIDKHYFAWLRQITPIVYDNAKSIYEVLSEIIPILPEIKGNQDDFSTEMDKHYNDLQQKKQQLEQKVSEYISTFADMVNSYREVYKNSKKDITDTIDDIISRYEVKYQEKAEALQDAFDTQTADINSEIVKVKSNWEFFYNFTLHQVDQWQDENLEQFSQKLANYISQINFNDKKTEITQLVNELYAPIIEKVSNFGLEEAIPNLDEFLNEVFANVLAKYFQDGLNDYNYIEISAKCYDKGVFDNTQLPLTELFQESLDKTPITNNLYRLTFDNNLEKPALLTAGKIEKVEFKSNLELIANYVFTGDLIEGADWLLGINNHIAYYLYYSVDRLYNNVYCYMGEYGLKDGVSYTKREELVVYNADEEHDIDSLVSEAQKVMTDGFKGDGAKIVFVAGKAYFILRDLKTKKNQLVSAPIDNIDASHIEFKDLDFEQPIRGITFINDTINEGADIKVILAYYKSNDIYFNMHDMVNNEVKTFSFTPPYDITYCDDFNALSMPYYNSYNKYYYLTIVTGYLDGQHDTVNFQYSNNEIKYHNNTSGGKLFAQDIYMPFINKMTYYLTDFEQKYYIQTRYPEVSGDRNAVNLADSPQYHGSLGITFRKWLFY